MSEGYEDDHTDFLNIIKNSNSIEWKLILFCKLNKFSRYKYEMAVHKKTLKDNGVKIISANAFYTITLITP